jgi:sirohydrochlorin ferrochelatase
VSRWLVILDHGSPRAEATEHLEWIATQVRERAPDLEVRTAHLGRDPMLGQVLDRCALEGARDIAVHPLFLLPGRHLLEDIPREIERARQKHPQAEIRLLDAVGSLPALADLILTTLTPVD